MEEFLQIKDLTTRFYTEDGVVYAVNGVSYTLEEGEILGVVGESGCGKSVHALSIMGLIPSPPERSKKAKSYLMVVICSRPARMNCGISAVRRSPWFFRTR